MAGGGDRPPERWKLPRRGEYPALWQAEAASVVGDQLAKVAIAMLVYNRTGSAGWSGIAYAANFLAPLLTGPLLAGLADRYPRRTLMVVCMFLQALCVSMIALPGTPVLLLVAGTMVVASLQVPVIGARGALVRQVLEDHMIEQHRVAPDSPERNALNGAGRARLLLIREIGQLAGLAGAVGVVLAIGTSWALVIDAVTFVAAAGLLRWRVRDRRSVSTMHAAGGAVLPELAGQLRAVWRLWRTDRAARLLTAWVALIGCTAAPDAVAVPLAAEFGAPTAAAGVLLAADCVGVAVGAWWLERQLGSRKARLIGPLAMLSMVPMALFWLEPALAAVGLRLSGSSWVVLVIGCVVLLVVSGVGSSYFSPAVAELTERVDEQIAGTTNSLFSTIIRASQGLGAITAGVVAQFSSAVMAVAVVGSLGVLLTSVCAVHWRQWLQRSSQVRSTAEA